MNSCVWFRRDLRVNDNLALWNAAQAKSDGLIGLFVVTPGQWRHHDEAPCKVKFWLDSLMELSNELSKLNIPLRIESCDTFADVDSVIVRFAKKHNCDRLFFNREYEVNEKRRDQAVTDACSTAGIAVQSFDDRVIVPPDELRTQSGKFYSVFTPYRRAWDQRVESFATVAKRPRKQTAIDVTASPVPTSVQGYAIDGNGSGKWKPGEREARRRLIKFVEQIDQYETARDFPSQIGTSSLSPYLAAGVISPRDCLMAACMGRLNEGASTWVSELTWRDFYTQVLVACPRVSKHRPFKLDTDNVPWRHDESEFERWTRGETGFPIVDAGMRQLNRTGWMHNRLRMVTAMFLTKNLLIDWRWGERYFMQHLIDGDLAANNGGWQWSASTGTDAAPYFRIFNPFSQSKRFDPQGEFIKQMCPELADIPAAALHDPKKLASSIRESKVDYPDFVVDYPESRTRTLDAFKSLS